MSIFITGNPRDIQIIKSGVTTYIPKKNAVVFTSGTEVGISYYGTGFSTTNEIIVLTYNAITSQTFSNSSAAATYLQDLIDSDQKYSNSIMSFSEISVIGSSNSYINLLSATTISGGTLYSGSTNLYNIFATPSFVQGLQTNVQPGSNTYTGGTSTSPSVNISALTISTLTASGNSIFTGTLSGGSSFSANTLYSGSTNLHSIFSQVGHTHQFSSILNTAHTHTISEVGNLSGLLDSKLNISGGTMTGGLTATTISATTISGGTLYSGSTNLYNIFADIGSVGGGQTTSIQPGLNTYTGGTSTSPSVNISALTISTLTVSGNSVLNTLTSNTLNINFLTGVTTRMVVVNSLGNLTAQTIPSASIWTYGTAAGSVKLNNGYTTAGSDYSLVAGKVNTINSNSHYSSILGGSGNKIQDNSLASIIVGGQENYIRDYGKYTFIGAGRNNYVLNGKHSVIPGGYGNRIYNNASNSESKYNSILNGYVNKIYRGVNCTVIGSYNIIGNGDLVKYSFISGKNNRIYASYSNIFGCYGVVLSDNYTTLVNRLQIAGTQNVANNYLLNINPSDWKVNRTSLSGGSGISITTAGGNLTITYTGSTSSGGGSSVINGLNTYTGGSSSVQSVNISAATLNNLTVTGITSLVSASTTYLQVNTSSASTTNRERVIVYDSQPTSYSNVFVGVASAQTYAQLNIRNLHNGSQASSDIIATADNGSETSNYIDLGINSSTFAGYVGFANDGYLYSTGNDLWIGNVTSNKSIKFFTDGTGTTNVRVNISSGGTYVQKLSADTIYSGSTDLSSLFEPRQTNYRQILATNYVMTSSTATAQFSFPVNAGEVYKAEMFSNYIVNNTGGMKLTISGDCVIAGSVKGNAANVLTAALRPLNSTGNTTNLGTASNTIFPYELEGIFSARTNTTIALGFSPQTNGQQITVLSGACMTLHKI